MINDKTNKAGVAYIRKSAGTAEAVVLRHVDEVRRSFNRTMARDDRSAIGQFLTPAPIARFMASLFERRAASARILDPGAGAGSLFAACTERLVCDPKPPASIEVVAYEIDDNIVPHLKATIELCRRRCAEAGIPFRGVVRQEDFIATATERLRGRLFATTDDGFTHAILNPPYKKINGQTRTRRLLNEAGIETSNLYAAFVWLAACLLQPEGEIVAITPRSFCNGPYFRRFRKALLGLMELRHLHTFESRKEAFSEDLVLQENLIVHGVRGECRNGPVRISVSKGVGFHDVQVREVPFHEVVVPNDSDAFIHLIEADDSRRVMERMSQFSTTLAELGLEVSTGRVVDFRAREFLEEDPSPGTVPLIYPCHFEGGFVRWPIQGAKKPNAIRASDRTEDTFVPAGYYVLTKRFTAKEERRRIVGAIYDPNRVDAPFVGFENHLNYFHYRGRGMPADLARGLAIFLNSSLLDRYFRLFSGHTQVNATDLRRMRYPTRQQMRRLGREMKSTLPEQERIDATLEKVCSSHG